MEAAPETVRHGGSRIIVEAVVGEGDGGGGGPDGVVPEKEAVLDEGKGVAGVVRVGRKEGEGGGRGRGDPGEGWMETRGGRGGTLASLRLFRLF